MCASMTGTRREIVNEKCRKVDAIIGNERHEREELENPIGD